MSPTGGVFWQTATAGRRNQIARKVFLIYILSGKYLPDSEHRHHFFQAITAKVARRGRTGTATHRFRRREDRQMLQWSRAMCRHEPGARVLAVARFAARARVAA